MNNKTVRFVVGVLFATCAMVLFVFLSIHGTNWDEPSRKAVAWIGVCCMSVSLVAIKWEEFKSLPSDFIEMFSDGPEVNVHPEVGESYVNKDVKRIGQSKFQSGDQADRYAVPHRPWWISK